MPSEKTTQESLIKKIKEKRELSGLANQIIANSLKNYLKKHKINLDNLKPPQIKIIVKEIRAELRLYSGQYQKSLKNRLRFLETNNIKELLKTHTSTSERLDFYPKLKKIINSLKISSILDLGCGLNPLALANQKITYYASDIKEDELSLIQQHFKKHNIKGKTFVYDIREIKADLPKADLYLLLKVFDIVAKNNHYLTEKILLALKSKYIITSFPTRKLSGKPMNAPKRFWFERILKNLNYKFKTFSSENEIFYLIKKPINKKEDTVKSSAGRHYSHNF